MDDEAVIESFLGEQPRAEQLAEWTETLERRLAALRREARVAAPAGRLTAEIKELERSLAALRRERAITEFVEDSVRVTLAMGSVADGGGEER